jgi:hypothetical protein
MKVFWDPNCLLHDPPYEIVAGDKVPYFESPTRLQVIKKELEQYPSSFTIELASSSSESSLNLPMDISHYVQMVHSEEYLRYLRNAYDNWVRSGLNTVPPPLSSLVTGILAFGLPFPAGYRATLCIFPREAALQAKSDSD